MKPQRTDQPIGIFDSGLGGLSVLKLLPSALPNERFVYVADAGRAPYGHRAKKEILDYSDQIVNYLIQVHHCKAIVIACNTATAASAKFLRKKYPNIPFIGMEPAIKPAKKATQSGVVGVMATAGTFGSEKYAELLNTYGFNIDVIEDPCIGLVALIEKGDLSSLSIQDKLTSILGNMMENKADTVVLGCTHFPLLKAQIKDISKGKLTIIDPAPAVAKQVKAVLTEKRLHADSKDPILNQRAQHLYSTGNINALKLISTNVFAEQKVLLFYHALSL